MSGAPFEHAPVMADEIVGLFGPVPPGYLLDATLGGGGHAERLLDAHPHLRLLGIDRDPDALEAARLRLARFGDRVVTYRCRFDHLAIAMEALSVDVLSGALFDLGVSSPQLDRAERGFSYRNDGPLDMRMDPDQPWSAADVVNGYTDAELVRVLRDLGDERFAARIARAIVSSRPIESTAQLSEIVVAAIPAATRRTGGHPARRTFQAIRIEVNGELDALPVALDAAIQRTVVGGRVGVLSYHSGEDRVTKRTFQRAVAGDCTCPPELACICGAVQTVRVVRRIAATPSAAEQASNPRSTSARLRAVERIAPASGSTRDSAPTSAQD